MILVLGLQSMACRSVMGLENAKCQKAEKLLEIASGIYWYSDGRMMIVKDLR